jgi:hypothetical protein
MLDVALTDLSLGMASESPMLTPKTKRLSERLGELTWEQITADGIITLSEIEAALEAKGYPPDSHDYLHD